MQRVDGSHGRGDAVALDVDVALRCHLVDVDVQNRPVSGAFVDDVIADFEIPVWRDLCRRIEHVREKETLRRDRRVHGGQLLLHGRVAGRSHRRDAGGLAPAHHRALVKCLGGHLWQLEASSGCKLGHQRQATGRAKIYARPKKWRKYLSNRQIKNYFVAYSFFNFFILGRFMLIRLAEFFVQNRNSYLDLF